MKKWPVERQILAGFVLAMVLMSVMGVVVYQSSRTFVGSYAAAQRSQEALTAVEAIRSLISRAAAEQRLYYFTRAEEDLAPRAAAFAGVEQRLAQLDALVGDEPQARALLEELERAVGARLRLLDWVLAGVREGGFPEFERRLRAEPGRLEVQRVEEVIERFEAAELARLRASQEAARHDAALSTAFVLLLLVVALTSVSMLFLRIRRDLAEQRAAREQLALQAEELRAGETRLRTVLNTAVDAIIVIHERGIVETFNPAAERIFG